jgi:hypothetical protein
MIDPRLAAPPAHDDGSDDQLHIHDYAARQLDAYIQLHGEASFVAAVSHTRSGDPAREIVALAKDLDSALVVVGTAGRTGMKRLLRGSVSEQVVRHSGSSVLVIPSEELAAAARDSVPSIEPPCPVCVAERLSSQGAEMWCSQHRGPSVQRHTSHTVPRNVAARENAPLTFPMD